MGSESSLWSTLRKNMKEYWEPERVENPAGPGTPDVYITMKANGKMHWIELKHVHKYPKRATTIIKVDHFSPQQKSFIRRHSKYGGSVWVMIQIEKDYFFFHGFNALNIGELTKEEYFTGADRVWKNRINYTELVDCLLIN